MTYSDPADMVRVTCAKCSIEFWITHNLNERRRHDGENFFCPNGHGNVYTQKPEDSKIKELEQELAKTKADFEAYRKDTE